MPRFMRARTLRQHPARAAAKRAECEGRGRGLGAARKMFNTLRTGFCHPIWRKAEGAPKEEVRQEGSMVKVCDTFSGPVGPSAGGDFDERG